MYPSFSTGSASVDPPEGKRCENSKTLALTEGSQGVDSNSEAVSSLRHQHQVLALLVGHNLVCRRRANPVQSPIWTLREARFSSCGMLHSSNRRDTLYTGDIKVVRAEISVPKKAASQSPAGSATRSPTICRHTTTRHCRPYSC